MYESYKLQEKRGRKIAPKLAWLPMWHTHIRTYAHTDVTSRRNAICPTPAFGRWGHKKSKCHLLQLWLSPAYEISEKIWGILFSAEFLISCEHSWEICWISTESGKLRRQFAWNGKTYYLQKIRKIFWIVLPTMLSLKMYICVYTGVRGAVRRQFAWNGKT